MASHFRARQTIVQEFLDSEGPLVGQTGDGS